MEKLNELFDKKLNLRITLSYFVEPNPSERPPKTKYSYASHDLRFKFQRTGESAEEFLERINADLASGGLEGEEQDGSQVKRGGDNWMLGPETRDRGSVISDVWTGTAADLSDQNTIAVVPQGGWWKHRLNFPNKELPRHAKKVRFSLILSLESEEDIDIYTPIMQKIKTPVTIS